MMSIRRPVGNVDAAAPGEQHGFDGITRALLNFFGPAMLRMRAAARISGSMSRALMAMRPIDLSVGAQCVGQPQVLQV